MARIEPFLLDKERLAYTIRTSACSQKSSFEILEQVPMDEMHIIFTAYNRCLLAKSGRKGFSSSRSVMRRVQGRLEQFCSDLPSLKTIDSGAECKVQLSGTLRLHERKARVSS